MNLYILRNELNHKLYIGITNNLERRLKEHNSSNSHFTGKISGNWKIIFNKNFISESEARKEEKRLNKAKNKKYLEWYIQDTGH